MIRKAITLSSVSWPKPALEPKTLKLVFWKSFIHMLSPKLTHASISLVTCSLPLHPSAIQPGLEHHFFSSMCQQKITYISPGEEQDQTLIILSMLIWLSRTNQRGDSKKKPQTAGLGFSGEKQAPDKLCLQSTLWFSWAAICFPVVIEMEQFSNSLPSLTSLTFMDWPPKFLEAEIQVPLASAWWLFTPERLGSRGGHQRANC